MTMPIYELLNEQAAAALSGGGGGCTKPPMPNPCLPAFPSFPCLPEIKIPEICFPKISIDWSKCKPSPC